MKYKSFIAKIAIILILALSFINSYNKTSDFVYADTITDQWTTVTTNQELADAFRYYCKSRNLAIEGSVADALTSFTTNTFNTICNTLGIDITALQAHLKRSTDSNGRVQFLFDQFGITAYNRIFAEFLQNNNLAIGDSADEANNTIYSGRSYTDKDGITVMCTILNTNNFTAGNKTFDNSTMIAWGTPYVYSGQSIYEKYSYPSTQDNRVLLETRTYNYATNKSENINFYYYDKTSAPTYKGIFFNSYNSTNAPYRLMHGHAKLNNVDYTTNNSIVTMFYNVVSDTYAFGFINKLDNNLYAGDLFTPFTPDVNQSNTAIIFLTTNNNTINNNTYTDNRQTVINNEGDVNNYDYDDDDPPVNPPSGGGGGDTTNVNIDFPNFDFNIPDIDFSLKGLTEKFPFCIPFDMVALLQLLNAEPQAPRIQGQIPFGSFFTWNLDLDFSRFDDFATIMRGLEFVGFIFFLISATINIAKG